MSYNMPKQLPQALYFIERSRDGKNWEPSAYDVFCDKTEVEEEMKFVAHHIEHKYRYVTFVRQT